MRIFYVQRRCRLKHRVRSERHRGPPDRCGWRGFAAKGLGEEGRPAAGATCRGRWRKPATRHARRQAYRGKRTAGWRISATALWRRWRDTFDWQQRLPAILLLSVITSSFTWMFDWVVLIPVLVVILVSLYSPSHRWYLIAGLLAIQAGLIVQPSFAPSNFFTIWMPLALALVYRRRSGGGNTVRRSPA